MNAQTQEIVNILSVARSRLRRQGGKPTALDLTQVEKKACRDGLNILKERADPDVDLIEIMLVSYGI